MKALITFIVVMLLAAGFMWGCWQWFFCRFYVDPDEMAVITAKIGEDLPPGQILAKKGQQGVQEEVLAEGRHFLNPFFYSRKIMPVVFIPPGKVGIVTSKVGSNLPDGEFLADPGQKGIWRGVLGPGKYRLNPVGYNIDIVNAISIPIGYDGVVTALSGKQAPENSFAKAGEKGVRRDILQPGLYYINPREFKVDVLEIGVNQVSLLGKGGGAVVTKAAPMTGNKAMDELQQKVLTEQKAKRESYLSEGGGMLSMLSSSRSRATAPQQQAQDMQQMQMDKVESSATFLLNQFVEFPSRDGFEISLDMTVEFELHPREIAWLFRSYGDLPAVVEKVIMPQILSVSRLKGSAYGARDFIVGEGREKFQNDLTDTLAKTLEEKKIIINNALIRHVNVPMQILDPIQQASIATEQDLTNKEKQNTARKMAELNTEQSMITQKREEVAQQTEKIKGEIKAEQEKQVAMIAATTIKEAALIEKQTAGVKAERVTKLGKAQADVVKMVEGEKAKGLQLQVKAFGDAQAFNLWTFANHLAEDLKINVIHAGPGTLWTDLEKARLGDLGGAQVLEAPDAKAGRTK